MTVTTVKFGNETWYYENGVNITERVHQAKQEIIEIIDSPGFAKKVDKFFKRVAIPTSIPISLLTIPSKTMAAGFDSSKINQQMQPIVELVQSLALPIGVLVSSWGLLEIIMGNFGSGKDKIKYAIIGFVGMFVVPNVFYTIQAAFN